MNPFLQAYLGAALWSSTGGDVEPLDASHDISDFAPKALKQAEEDCRQFQEGNAADLEESGLSAERAGHDFWLNRNGHGSGFWDEGNAPVFHRLSSAAKVWGSCDPYVGDDGLIYFA